MNASAVSPLDSWPDLPLDAWKETYATLHMWTQIVGKIRLAQCPWVNHSWHATLYVTARGLTTSLIPHGTRSFQIDFDFVGHHLTVQASDGGSAGFTLEPMSVSVFYKRLMEEMRKLDLNVNISCKPNEVADPIRFDQDETTGHTIESTPTGSGVSWCKPTASLKYCAPASQASAARALFLGCSRHCSHPVFRTQSSCTSGWRSKSAGLGDSRGLLGRSEQLRILARRWPDSLCCVLLLCVSRTGWIRQCSSQAERGFL